MIQYKKIAREVFLKTDQMADGDATTRESHYASAWNLNQDGTEIPVSSLKNVILAVEKNLARLVSMSNNPLLQASLLAKTVDLPNASDIPTSDASGREFIGSFVGVYDAVTKRPLTEQPKQTVFDRTANTGTFFTSQDFHYCIDGGILFHTRPNAFLKACSWDLTTQTTALNNYANGTSPLPQELETLFIAEVLSNLPQEGWFISEANYYLQIAEREKQMYFDIKQQSLNTRSIADSTVSNEPVKN